MENASNALLIAGAILIAMLILATGIYLFATSSGLGDTYERTMETTEIQKFNANFTKFEGRADITIQEIVSLANFAKQQTDTEIIVNLSGEGNLTTKTDENFIELIKDNSTKTFKCQAIQDSDYSNGKITKITFVE